MRAHPERDIQEAIVDALHLCGCTVYQTSAWRQKGPSGVMPGIPDLLVRWPGMASGFTLGIEVKAPKGTVSPAQVAAMLEGVCVGIAHSPREALQFVVDAMDYSVPEALRLKAIEILRGLA